MSEFEKWYEKEKLSGWADRVWAKLAYETGQQSQQAKTNDLQAKLVCCREENKGLLNKINEALGLIKNNTHLIGKTHPSIDDLIEDVESILKGNKND